jgi:hypothetical protein
VRLGPDGLNAATLDAYPDEFAETQNCRVLILATRGGRGQKQARELDNPSRGMLALSELEPLSHVVELNERLDASETADAAAVLASLSLWDSPQVERYGPQAHLVGGPAPLESLRTARGADGRTNCAGQHLAWLVAWWTHIGIVEPVSREQLKGTWQAYPDPEAGAVGGVIDTPCSGRTRR